MLLLKDVAVFRCGGTGFGAAVGAAEGAMAEEGIMTAVRKTELSAFPFAKITNVQLLND